MLIQRERERFQTMRKADPYRSAKSILEHIKSDAAQERFLDSLDWSRFGGERQEVEYNGFSLTIEVKPDDSGALFERERFDSIGRSSLPEAVYEHGADCDRSERESVRYADLGDSRYSWYKWESDESFSEIRALYSKDGASRSQSYALALANVDARFKADCEAMREDYCGVVVEVRDPSTGETLAEDSCWGFQYSDLSYGVETVAGEALREAESIRADSPVQYTPHLESADA